MEFDGDRLASGDQPHSAVTVAVVNDYEVIVAGITAMLQPYRSRVAVVETDVEREPGQAVDVALFDSYGQFGLGEQRIRALAESEQVGAVALYTWTLGPADRATAQRAGVRGFVGKSLPAAGLVPAIEAVARGEEVDTDRFRTGVGGSWPGSEWGLSARESETLALLINGLTNRAIAEGLFVSENTVRTHVKAIFRKLGVNNRSQAVARALTDPSFSRRDR